MTKEITLTDWVHGLLQELDSKLSPVGDTGYAEAAVMFSAIPEDIGANEKTIANELGYDPEFVALVGNRLRRSGIWSGRTVDPRAMRRWEDENGGIAMMCDMNVARGDFMVTSYEGDEPRYKNTEAGERRVRQLLGRSAA